MTGTDVLRSLLAYAQRESDRRAKGAHQGMTRLHDAELAALLALLRREVEIKGGALGRSP